MGAALRILDDHGLQDLTMRRIAEAVGLQVGALYRHFPDKQTLLAAVSDRILTARDTAVAPEAPWQEQVTASASLLRDLLLSYRDGAELVSSSFALGLTDVPTRSVIEQECRRAGLPWPLARVAADTITHYVIGFTFHEQQRIQAESIGAADKLPAGSSAWPSTLPGYRDAGFQSGLQLIVSGLATRVGTAL